MSRCFLLTTTRWNVSPSAWNLGLKGRRQSFHQCSCHEPQGAPVNGLGLDGDLHALATYIVWTLDVTVIDLPNFFFSMFVSALHHLRLNS